MIGILGIVGGTLLTLGMVLGGGKKKKKKAPADPSADDMAAALAEAEAAGMVEVTEDGEIIEREAPTEEVEAVADALAAAEAAGEVAVTETGEVIETAEPWEVMKGDLLLVELAPDSAKIRKKVKKQILDMVDDVKNVTGTDAGTYTFEVIADRDFSIFSDSLREEGVSGTIVDVQVIAAPGDEADAETEAVADELAAAEAAGEVAVTEEGDIIETAPEAVEAETEAVADELAAAEAAGEVAVTEEGEVIETAPAADPLDEALAQKLIAAERDMGSLWKTAHQADVQAWQIRKGLVADGKFGPKGGLSLADSGVSVIPLVRFWPKGALQETAVTRYKVDLQGLQGADQNAVQVALMRERGQGFGTARALRDSELA